VKPQIEMTSLSDVLTEMAEDQMPEPVQDTFTLTDRKELIRHGLQLEALSEDMSDLKVLFNEAIKLNETVAREAKAAAEVIKGAVEDRLRKLEDERLILKTQMTTIRWVAGLIGGVVGVLVNLAMRFWK
jgi:DNA repair exonuclease SbcCD ATPase subunit